MKNTLKYSLHMQKNPDMIPFDQVIAERCDRNGNRKWIHVSYNLTRVRAQFLFN